MVAEKLNPPSSNLIDLGDKIHDALSQLTLGSKDIPPQSPLTSPSPLPSTAATPTFHPLTYVDATPPDTTDDLSEDESTEGAITPKEGDGYALAAEDENKKEKKSIFDLAWETMVAQGFDVTGGKNINAIINFLEDNLEWLSEHTNSNGAPPIADMTVTFHSLTHVDATSLDDTADFDEDELTESTIASTQETWSGDNLVAGDGNNEGKKSLFDLAWEAMAAQGIDVTGGKNMTAIANFLEENPEWLEEHTVSNGEPSILQRGKTLKLEDLKQTCLDYTDGASDVVPETMEEYLTFLGDRMVDEQMMDVFAYVADNVLAGLVNKESEYDLYEKQAAGLTLYLDNPPTPISPYYKRRYETQLNCLNQILDIFDSAEYSNENYVLKKEVSYLTSEMLTRGSLPEELKFPFKYQVEMLPMADDDDD